MQEYINNYYYENDLSYLLLVGDISQIPTHIVNGAASDPTFGFIEVVTLLQKYCWKIFSK